MYPALTPTRENDTVGQDNLTGNIGRMFVEILWCAISEINNLPL